MKLVILYLPYIQPARKKKQTEKQYHHEIINNINNKIQKLEDIRLCDCF